MQESLRDWLVELRRVLRRHPWAAALAIASVERGPNMLRHWDRGATLLLDAGFDERQVFYGLSMLLTYAVGTGVKDTMWHSYEADDQTEIREETLSRRPSSSVPSTPPRTRPFQRLTPVLASHDEEEQCLAGLDLLIAGLRAQR